MCKVPDQPVDPQLADDAEQLDVALLRRLVVNLAAIDREVKRYHDGLEGRRPWTDFDVPWELKKAA